MSLFYLNWKSRNEVLNVFDVMAKYAQNEQFIETKSATLIQKVFRGHFSRANVALMTMAQTTISRLYRGYMDRKRIRFKREKYAENQNINIYHFNALRIQTIFRGYYSRCHRHNFQVRRAYIAYILQKGEVLREKLRQKLNQQQMDQMNEEKMRMKKEFSSIARNLHHLLGTKSVPGVYGKQNNRNLKAEVNPPTVFGVAVEEHIRSEVRKVILERSKHNVLRKKIINKPKNRISIRASSSFQAEENLKEQEKRLNQLRRLSSVDFDTSCKTHIPLPKYKAGINCGAKYMDSYKNPYLKRGIPKNRLDLDPDRTTLEKHPSNPFYTAVSGRKDSILPNGLFD